MSRISNFYEQIYNLVRQIPVGRVMTYGQVALLLDKPHGARAVGWALHQLPADTDVPWQRVINAQGKCSNFFQMASPFTQQDQLEGEGVNFNEDGVTDLKIYRWNPPEILVQTLKNI